MSNPKGTFFSSKKYFSVDEVKIETSIKKQHTIDFFEVCFNWYNVHRWRYIKTMSKLYLVSQKINIKTHNFTIITSSFLEVKAIARYILKSRSSNKVVMDKVLQIPYQYYNKTFSWCKNKPSPFLIFFEYNCNT